MQDNLPEIEQAIKGLPKEFQYHILIHSHYDSAWYAKRKVTKRMLPQFFAYAIKAFKVPIFFFS